MAAASVSEHGSTFTQHLGVCVNETGGLKGKALLSTKEYQEGDTIFQEYPVVCAQFLWNAAYEYTACDHCMKSLETAQEMARRLSGNPTLELPYAGQCCEVTRSAITKVVCPQCQIVYCSEECRQNAVDQYHRTLCLGHPGDYDGHPLVKLQEAWKNMHYPPETANVMLITRMVATVLQAPDSLAVLEMFSKFCHSILNKQQHIVHKLLGEQFQEQLDILRILLLEALYDEQLEKWFTPEGFLSVFALIGTNGQGIGTSSLSVYVHNIDDLPALSADERQAIDLFLDQLYDEMDKVSGQFLNCEGAGLYQLQSCCNHSCVPNAEVTFPYNNSTLVLKALQHIQAGEEICISYLDECQRERSRYSRQKYLRENYVFNCACVKCELQANDPDKTSSEEEDDDQ